MHWVEMLPDTQTPSWLGLPSNAEKVLLTTQGMPQHCLNPLYSVAGPKITTILLFRLSWSQVSSLTLSLYYSSSLSLTGCISSTERVPQKQTRGFFCFVVKHVLFLE